MVHRWSRTGWGWGAVLIFGICCVFSGCAQTTYIATAGSQSAVNTWDSVQLTGFPHVRQKPDFCGEACVEMVLKQMGRPETQDDVFAATGLDPALNRGAWTRDLKVALENLNFTPGPVWYTVDAKRSRPQLDGLWTDLHKDLKAGIPSIVCMHYDDQPQTTEHFRLITGYDAARDEVIYQEPAESNGADRRMARTTFLKLWPLKYEAERWTVIRFAMRAIPDPKRTPLESHIDALRKDVPNGFSVVAEPPFAVVGDEAPARVQQRATHTVAWAVKHLKKQYFANDPDEIYDIWLFKDSKSYHHHAKARWGVEPDTPYGYASSQDKVLVMNISTGGGTLVHEIVHPYIAANFPQSPSWFNEGLASLYEQSAERDGSIVGLTNWRLAGLQRTIRAGRLPSFKTLTATTTRQFYDEDPGSHYAQSRYLMYYLQEKGLLRSYYHGFVKNHPTDPTGYATLKQTLGVTDMAAFQRKWEQWILTLKY